MSELCIKVLNTTRESKIFWTQVAEEYLPKAIRRSAERLRNIPLSLSLSHSSSDARKAATKIITTFIQPEQQT